MGDLKPLGSERLQGLDKIQRIMEIARFRETMPTPVNETSKSEYALRLADGNEYQIIREKSGYIIKQTLSESTLDYIAPMQDRTYFKSYSQALKRLNLMAREMNAKYGNDAGTSLFSEQKKYVLKTPDSLKKNTNITDEIENVPAPAQEPSGSAPATPPAPGADSSPMDDMGGMDDSSPMDDMGGMDDSSPMDDMGGMDDHTTPSSGEHGDEAVTFKLIQKLTGKLGQKLRTLNSNEDTKMSSKDIKYVINSIISALDLEALSDDDKEDIVNKFEGIEAEEGMGDMDTDKTSDEDEMSSDMPTDETPDDTTSELGESGWGDFGNEVAIRTHSMMAEPGRFNEDDEDDESHIGRIADEVFMESKVENVLTSYFKITETEQKFNKKLVTERKKIVRSQLLTEIKRLSETKQQELGAKKFLQENTNAKLIGKTNKKNLVFEMNNKQIKITPTGIKTWSI